MKTTTKFIVFHPSVQKAAGAGAGHRAWLVVFVLFFIFTFVFTLVTTKEFSTASAADSSGGAAASRLPQPLADALIHYAIENSTAATSGRMSPAEIKSVASVLRRCAAPCNLLVFGLTHETLLWHALNHHRGGGGGGGRTVFVGENSYQISKMEEVQPWIEAYDVQFATKVRELPELMDHYRREARKECRPVQNLLFSDCRLAINDLPNHVYDLAWDVILVDGPPGYAAEAPGRMAAIFTAGVLARTRRAARGTHVFVHQIEREVEKVCSQEFLCPQNLVEIKDSLAHFLINNNNNNNNDNYEMGFCSNLESSGKSTI
ncbi:protein IRX15-LIKE-like [Andrographis paniculata]|uniref:protein IRX15-LIKE-like n=1 Tax=Andrographis paniculata TaxID=175694 RepID=UPI0021E83742|nr:protein IRX15-LIKE-like [Andrographis paniculata]